MVKVHLQLSSPSRSAAYTLVPTEAAAAMRNVCT